MGVSECLVQRLGGGSPATMGPDIAKVAESLQLIGTPWVMTKGEIYEGLEVSMELFPHHEDPIADRLPFNAVLGAYIVKGTMYTDGSEWSVLHDYNKQ